MVFDNDKNYAWQWDENRKVLISREYAGSYVHFCMDGDTEAMVVEPVYDSVTGMYWADVPNQLLTKSGILHTYIYLNSHTVVKDSATVKSRQKPQNYVYTPTEVRSYEMIDERLSTVEDNYVRIIDFERLENSIPVKVSQLSNDSGYLTQHQSLAAYRTASDQDNIDRQKVNKEEGKALSSNDYTDDAKSKVDAIPSNPKYTDTVYDDAAIKGRIAAIEQKESTWDAKSDFSGDYNDLQNKPEINITVLGLG